jgi:hypothetical protein
MRRLATIAVAVTMASLFSLMFWSQVGAVATAVARPKHQSYLVNTSPYLPLQVLEPVY